jgi:hypothetical protein
VTKIEIREDIKFVVIDSFLNGLNKFESFRILTIDLSKFVFKSI